MQDMLWVTMMLLFRSCMVLAPHTCKLRFPKDVAVPAATTLDRMPTKTQSRISGKALVQIVLCWVCAVDHILMFVRLFDFLFG